MNNYDELRQRVAVTRERVEMAEHESNCLVYGIGEPHECSCVVGELADLVSDLLDENVALRAMLVKWVPHLRRHGCDGLGLEYVEELAKALGDAS